MAMFTSIQVCVVDGTTVAAVVPSFRDGKFYSTTEHHALPQPKNKQCVATSRIPAMLSSSVPATSHLIRASRDVLHF